MLEFYFKFRKPTLEGNKYTIKNPLVILRKTGIIKLSDGYEIEFNKENKYDILRVVFLALNTGVTFGTEKYQWKFDQKNGILETHQGIRFKISGIGLLDETFLSQIHFSGFDIKGKTVVTGGAYIGDTPLFYSYYGANVFAFEPDPNSFKKAEENILLNPNLQPNIELMNYAIGEDGEVKFPVNSNSGISSIYETSNKKTVTVKSVSVSTILTEFNIKQPYLLDLDIKGSEFTTILDNSISKFEKIRIEYSPYLLNTANNTLELLVRKLNAYGFNKIRVYKHNDLRFDLMNHGTLEAEK